MKHAERPCTLLLRGESGTTVQEAEIIADLENSKGGDELKQDAVKRAVTLLLNGEHLPNIVMTCIRYCINSRDHALKRYLLLFWEVCPKYDANGKLREEMILVCNAMKNDLTHPNEFIRGCTLRLLCRLREPEIIEPLVPSIKECLTHNKAFVRRNAVFTIGSIHTHSPDMLPDAAELMDTFVRKETDNAARRNAFLVLFSVDVGVAAAFLLENLEQVQRYGDGFQLGALELIRKVVRADPSQKSRFVQCLFQLLNSESAAVRYETSWTLVSLSSSPTALRAVCGTYTDLLNSAQTDNNVKLIVLERLSDLRRTHPKIMRESLMDVLRALSVPNADIRSKTLSLAIGLVTMRTIDDVVMVLKKEVLKTSGSESSSDEAAAYRSLLVSAIHKCAVKFPDVAPSVVHLLMEFLDVEGSAEVITFIRELVDTYPDMREEILNRLLTSTIHEVKSARVMRVVLWIVGDYCDQGELVKQAFDALKGALKGLEDEFDGAEKEEEVEAEAPAAGSAAKPSTGPVVLADGTYAKQSAVDAGVPADAAATASKKVDRARLHALIVEEDGGYYVAAVLASALTKLCLRLQAAKGADAPEAKAATVDALLLMCKIIQTGQRKTTGGTQRMISSDAVERIHLCMRVLAEPRANAALAARWLSGGRAAYAAVLDRKRTERAEEITKERRREEEEARVEPDKLIAFQHLRRSKALGATDVDLDDEANISKATKLAASGGPGSASALERIYQLTGFADPVYAEAKVEVHGYDIVLSILVINRTPETLSNLALELATMGDLKIVERPQAFTIGPLDTRRISSTIKVASTETGHIYGSITYDNSSGSEKTYVNLSDIHIDIMDYIKPATCTDKEFRSMWAEFEWENKVAVSTSKTDLGEYLQLVIDEAKMNCLTPVDTTKDECGFLAVNLYARSIFGEDALVNLSVEQLPDKKIVGYIRIRSKTQGIALSLGDRITLKQKGD